MSVRSAALRWLASAHGVRDGDIFTSRFYPAAESWTGRPAWWLQVPVHRVEALGSGLVHLVCEAAPGEGAPSGSGRAGARAFHYLRVPASYLREHLDALDRPGDGGVASLFLSAEPEARFRDERGAGRVAFAQFEARSERGGA